MRPLLCTQLPKRGVDRRVERTIGNAIRVDVALLRDPRLCTLARQCNAPQQCRKIQIAVIPRPILPSQGSTPSQIEGVPSQSCTGPESSPALMMAAEFRSSVTPFLGLSCSGVRDLRLGTSSPPATAAVLRCRLAGVMPMSARTRPNCDSRPGIPGS
jgi:hypothetical protein